MSRIVAGTSSTRGVTMRLARAPAALVSCPSPASVDGRSSPSTRMSSLSPSPAPRPTGDTMTVWYPSGRSPSTRATCRSTTHPSTSRVSCARDDTVTETCAPTSVTTCTATWSPSATCTGNSTSSPSRTTTHGGTTRRHAASRRACNAERTASGVEASTSSAARTATSVSAATLTRAFFQSSYSVVMPYASASSTRSGVAAESVTAGVRSCGGRSPSAYRWAPTHRRHRQRLRFTRPRRPPATRRASPAPASCDGRRARRCR